MRLVLLKHTFIYLDLYLPDEKPEQKANFSAYLDLFDHAAYKISKSVDTFQHHPKITRMLSLSIVLFILLQCIMQ